MGYRNHDNCEKLLLSKLEQIVPDATEGLKIQAFERGRKFVDIDFGKTYKVYDWASLTKIVFSVTACMVIFEKNKHFLGDKLTKHLAWWPNSKTTIKELLTHSAGNTWWSPFYKSIDQDLSHDLRWLQMAKLLSQTEKQSRQQKQKAIYSDIDFLLLGFVLESIYQKPLFDIWAELAADLDLEDVHFNINNKPRLDKKNYAPTERCLWRKKVLRGEVHDENCWSVGGISSHAGLFGTMNDLSKWALGLRGAYYNQKKWVAKSSTVKLFAKRALPKHKGHWSLGFMMPTPGSSSAGNYFSSESIGHTGFTGTSMWFDPKNDLLVTILSNRVNPTRNNNLFIKMRPVIHDFIFQYTKKA